MCKTTRNTLRGLSRPWNPRCCSRPVLPKRQARENEFKNTSDSRSFAQKHFPAFSVLGSGAHYSILILSLHFSFDTAARTESEFSKTPKPRDQQHAAYMKKERRCARAGRECERKMAQRAHGKIHFSKKQRTKQFLLMLRWINNSHTSSSRQHSQLVSSHSIQHPLLLLSIPASVLHSRTPRHAPCSPRPSLNHANAFGHQLVLRRRWKRRGARRHCWVTRSRPARFHVSHKVPRE